jgi:hypothetical protein
MYCKCETNVATVLVGKPEGNGLLGIPTCRWEGNIKIDLTEIGWMIWPGQRPVVCSCEHNNEPSGSIKYWGILE